MVNTVVQPLPNPRQEAFAQGVASGMPLAKAYVTAGYRAKSRQVADRCAFKLRRVKHVSARIEQLTKATKVLDHPTAPVVAAIKTKQPSNGPTLEQAFAALAQAQAATSQAMMAYMMVLAPPIAAGSVAVPAGAADPLQDGACVAAASPELHGQ